MTLLIHSFDHHSLNFVQGPRAARLWDRARPGPSVQEAHIQNNYPSRDHKLVRKSDESCKLLEKILLKQTTVDNFRKSQAPSREIPGFKLIALELLGKVTWVCKYLVPTSCSVHHYFGLWLNAFQVSMRWVGLKAPRTHLIKPRVLDVGLVPTVTSGRGHGCWLFFDRRSWNYKEPSPLLAFSGSWIWNGQIPQLEQPRGIYTSLNS